MENNTQHLCQQYGILESYFQEDAVKQFNEELTVHEKVFAYYMSKAAIAGYPIALIQKSKCNMFRILTQLLYIIYKFDSLMQSFQIYDITKQKELKRQLKTYWIYLFINYGPYFSKEFKNNKKNPHTLGLNLITPQLLKKLGMEASPEVWRYLFDLTFYPTSRVPDNIEQSGNNFYGYGMTTALYNTLTQQTKNQINARYMLPPKDIDAFNENKVAVDSYHSHGIGGHYIKKCLTHLHNAMRLSLHKEFNEHTYPSLQYLIRFLEYGDEEWFRKHSAEWLKLKNRVEYTFGFIECYDDPMGKIGTFQADVTLKSLKLDNLLSLLPSFEKRFPFPNNWKRENMESIPNAAKAHRLMGIGGLGPGLHVIAYCLPNYNDIRSELGSKQIMYTLPKPSNMEQYKKIYLSSEEHEFYNKVSPDLTLDTVIHSLLVTLHETIGHASGRNNGDKGQNIFGKWENALEEMRAEIIALYTAIHFYDEIVNSGILGEWPKKIESFKMKELMILYMLNLGWKRWEGLPITDTEDNNVVGAHMLANTAIMYYLIDHSNGKVELTQDNVKSLPVLRIIANDILELEPVIEKLAYKVQKMSSIGSKAMVEKFMKKYACNTRNTNYISIVRTMQEANKMGVKMSCQVFPELVPIYGEYGIIDVKATIPKSPFKYYVKIFNEAFY